MSVIGDVVTRLAKHPPEVIYLTANFLEARFHRLIHRPDARLLQ